MKALRILVVEDDAITGMLLGELLTSMGYDVCAIESTEADAVTAAARCRPDLMIVDVRLGDGSGVSAVEEILRAGPVSHIFVSGDISGVPVLTPDTLIIRKPYREPDLAQAIQRAIGAGTYRDLPRSTLHPVYGSAPWQGPRAESQGPIEPCYRHLRESGATRWTKSA